MKYFFRFSFLLILLSCDKKEPPPKMYIDTAPKTDTVKHITIVPDILPGCSVKKAVSLCVKLAESNNSRAYIIQDTIVKFAMSSVGHDGKLQSYTEKITVGKTKEGASVTLFNDWIDGYSSTMNETFLHILERYNKTSSL